MAPKKSWTVITNPGTNDIPLPPLKNFVAKAPGGSRLLLGECAQGAMEAEVPAEGSSSTGRVHSFQTLFHDNNKGHGVTISPRSVVRMRIDRSEILFKFVRFEAKTSRHSDFKGWMDHILSQQT